MKQTKIVFITCTALLLLLPLFFTNLKSNIASPLDNRMLASIPTTIKDWRLEGENVLKDRIGFRDQMLLGYHTGLYKLFNHIEHPLFARGEDGHVYFGYEGYLNDLQALNYTEDFINQCVDGLTRMRNNCKEKGVKFLYIHFPDKKTVYPEHYNKNVHRQVGVPTLSEALQQALQNTDLHYVFTKDALIAAKAEAPTYNKKFDPGHFNAFGAFIGHREVAKKLQEIFPGYPLPELSEFDFDSKEQSLMQYLSIVDFDSIPTLKLKNQSFEITHGKSNDFYYLYSTNPQAPVDKVAFIAGDSYMNNCDCYEPTKTAIEYYAKAFREVYFVKTYYDLQRLSEHGCDILIYETAERVVPLGGLLRLE